MTIPSWETPGKVYCYHHPGVQSTTCGKMRGKQRVLCSCESKCVCLFIHQHTSDCTSNHQISNMTQKVN